jgi:hypothetical protein
MSTFNYFNYFTEIEEYFWRKRGAHLLVSPLDWAILETWQQAEIPISAVLKGIDRAFESYGRSKRGQSGRQLKSLAYCVEAVLDAAEEEKEALAGAGPSAESSRAAETESFSRDQLKAYLLRNIEQLNRTAVKSIQWHNEIATLALDTVRKLAAMLPLLDPPAPVDLEDLERRLTICEERISAKLRDLATDDQILEIRRDLDRQLAAYRRKMTTAQLSDLERRYAQKRLFESAGIPRLSLFYMSYSATI